MNPDNLPQLIRKHTAFKDMDEMLNAIDYRPTLKTNCHGVKKQAERNDCSERWLIAHEYDRLQAERGDDRRAYCY